MGLAFSDGTGLIEAQRSWVQPGVRDLAVTGNLSSVSHDATSSVRDRVTASFAGIASRLNVPEDSLTLIKAGRDLHVHIEHGFCPIVPSYQTGAIYLAMVSLTIAKRPRTDTTTFRDVGNSTGIFSSIWEFSETTIKYCSQLGYRRSVLGGGIKIKDKTRATADVIQRDGRPLVELIVVGSILDALPLAVLR